MRDIEFFLPLAIESSIKSYVLFPVQILKIKNNHVWIKLKHKLKDWGLVTSEQFPKEQRTSYIPQNGISPPLLFFEVRF